MALISLNPLGPKIKASHPSFHIARNLDNSANFILTTLSSPRAQLWLRVQTSFNFTNVPVQLEGDAMKMGSIMARPCAMLVDDVGISRSHFFFPDSDSEANTEIRQRSTYSNQISVNEYDFCTPICSRRMRVKRSAVTSGSSNSPFIYCRHGGTLLEL